MVTQLCKEKGKPELWGRGAVQAAVASIGEDGVSVKRVHERGMPAFEEGLADSQARLQLQEKLCGPRNSESVVWGLGKRAVSPSPSTGKGKTKKVAPKSDTGMSSKNSLEMAGQEEGGAGVQTEEEEGECLRGGESGGHFFPTTGRKTQSG